MSHLLHIDAIAAATNGLAQEIAGITRRAWQREHPEGTVVYRDLGAEPVPHVDDIGVSADHMPRAFRTSEQDAALAVHDGLAAEVLGADALLITAPLLNGMISSTLKAWIDQLSLVGRSVAFGVGTGPLAGKKVTFVLSYGGGYCLNGFAEPYLRAVFGDLFGMDVTIVDAESALVWPTPDTAGLALAS